MSLFNARLGLERLCMIKQPTQSIRTKCWSYCTCESHRLDKGDYCYSSLSWSNHSMWHETCTNRQVGTPPCGWRDDTQGRARKAEVWNIDSLLWSVVVGQPGRSLRAGLQMFTGVSCNSSFRLSHHLTSPLWPRPRIHEEILLWAMI